MTSEGSKVGRVHVDKEKRRPGLNIRSIKRLSHNPDLITLRNCNTIEAGVVERLSVLTFKPKVGGGSNPIFFYFFF